MAFVEPDPSPQIADGPFWQQPEATHGDDLDTPALPNGGGGYEGIPQALNGRFDTYEDAPGASVPPALAPSMHTLPVSAPPEAPAKDND